MNTPRTPHGSFTSITTMIDLAQTLPTRLTLPKFQLGQTVQWVNISPSGFGTIIGLIYASSASVVGDGYHYLVLIDSASPSRSDCIADWAFEEDLDLMLGEMAA